jgi:hypothetical protein
MQRDAMDEPSDPIQRDETRRGGRQVAAAVIAKSLYSRVISGFYGCSVLYTVYVFVKLLWLPLKSLPKRISVSGTPVY